MISIKEGKGHCDSALTAGEQLRLFLWVGALAAWASPASLLVNDSQGFDSAAAARVLINNGKRWPSSSLFSHCIKQAA